MTKSWVLVVEFIPMHGWRQSTVGPEYVVGVSPDIEIIFTTFKVTGFSAILSVIQVSSTILLIRKFQKHWIRMIWIRTKNTPWTWLVGRVTVVILYRGFICFNPLIIEKTAPFTAWTEFKWITSFDIPITLFSAHFFQPIFAHKSPPDVKLVSFFFRDTTKSFVPTLRFLLNIVK